MSSHHIVRDEQEPALLILHEAYSQELLGNLLEWSPTVIVDAELVQAVSSNHFKIDIVIGVDEEIEKSKEYLRYQEPIKYLSKNKEDSTLLQALYYLSATNYKAVNILAPYERFEFDIINPFIHKLSIVVYNKGFKWYFIRNNSFHKWMKKRG